MVSVITQNNNVFLKPMHHIYWWEDWINNKLLWYFRYQRLSLIVYDKKKSIMGGSRISAIVNNFSLEHLTGYSQSI